ncbi:hypothetical protein RR46_10104 [Papilio xuthus]|uniref:Uncharacterized protein n=1 Tax=Papilio xuthus TaxID=66420 RepID=A0A194PZN7_PAPXU|nr:hypothetical protein RR46_10104 [Papilio xuthus]
MAAKGKAERWMDCMKENGKELMYERCMDKVIHWYHCLWVCTTKVYANRVKDSEEKSLHQTPSQGKNSSLILNRFQK